MIKWRIINRCIKYLKEKLKSQNNYNVEVKINTYSGSVLKLIDGYYTYTGEDFVIERINYKEFDNNPNCIDQYIKKGFVELFDSNDKRCLPVTLNNILEQKHNRFNFDFFILKRPVTDDEIIKTFIIGYPYNLKERK